MRKSHCALLVVGLILVVAVGYQYRTEIPRSVYTHFKNLDEVEFCTIQTDIREDAYYESMDMIPPRRVDLGFIHREKYPIGGLARIADHGQFLDKLSWADRQNNSMAGMCFIPRHAIRDPNNHDNYILICFECMLASYECNGSSGKARIATFPEPYANILVAQLGIQAPEALPRSEESLP